MRHTVNKSYNYDSLSLNYINQPYVLSSEQSLLLDGVRIDRIEWSVDLLEGYTQFLYNQYRIAQLTGYEPALVDGVDKILSLTVAPDATTYYPQVDKLRKLEFKNFIDKHTACTARERGAINLDQILKDGLTRQEFSHSAKDLLALQLDTKVDPDSSTQDRSVVNFINQKDIITDEDYKNVLTKISEEQTIDILTATKYYPLVG